MAQAKASVSGGPAATPRKPPAWYDGVVAYDERLPGLPDFVSVKWIDTWAAMSKDGLRSLHERISRKRKDAYPWWPAMRPDQEDFAYLLAMAMRHPADFAALLREHVVPTQRAGANRATFFRSMHQRSPDEQGGMRMFLDLLEDPDASLHRLRENAGAEDFLAAFDEDPTMVPVLEWMRDALPVHAAVIDAARGSVATPETKAPVAEQPAAPSPGPEAAVASPGEPVLPEPAPEPVAKESAAPASGAPAAVAAPVADPEMEEAVRLFRVALEGVREAAGTALASGEAGRSVLIPVAGALRDAGRVARRHDQLLAGPVDVGASLEVIRSCIARVEALRSGLVTASLPDGVGGVRRSSVAGIAEAARVVTEISGRLEETFQRAVARTQEMTRTNDFGLAAEILDMQRIIASEVAELGISIEAAAATIEAARAEAAAAAAKAAAQRPVPVAAPVALPPSADPLPEAAAPTPPLPAPVGHVAYVAPAVASPAPETRVAPSPSEGGDEHVSSAVLRLMPSREGFLDVVGVCLDWMAGKPGVRIPAHAHGGESFESEGEGPSARAVSIQGNGNRFWCGRLSEPERRNPQRLWIVEACVGQDKDGTLTLGMRLLTSSPQGRYTGIRTLPRLVRESLSVVPAADAGLTLSADVLDFRGDAGADALRALLGAPGRRLPVVMVPLDASGKPGVGGVADTARALAGAAHVVTLDVDGYRSVAADVGRDWGQRDAVLMFRPGVTAPHVLQRGLLQRLERRRGPGPHAFVEHVCNLVLQDSATRFADQRIPTFDECLAIAAQAPEMPAAMLADEVGAIPADISGHVAAAVAAERARHMEEIDRFGRDKATADALLHEADNDLRAAELQNIETWARTRALENEVARLRGLLSKQPGAEPFRIPTNADELADFAETGIGGGVIVLSRAVKRIAKSRNLNIRRAYDGLVFLRDKYLPMRRGEIDQKAYADALSQYRFVETPSLKDLNTAHLFEGYHIMWKGRTVVLDRHLKWGKGAVDTMVRIYFHYDAEEQVVVVGHMPCHLDNHKTT